MTMDFVKVKEHFIPCVTNTRPDGGLQAAISIWDWPWREEITVANQGVDWHDVKLIFLAVTEDDIVRYENPLTSKKVLHDEAAAPNGAADDE